MNEDAISGDPFCCEDNLAIFDIEASCIVALSAPATCTPTYADVTASCQPILEEPCGVS